MDEQIKALDLRAAPPYSQKGQDRWVLNEIYPGVTNGFFVELGAADGVRYSNTLALEEAGWQGLCIEYSADFEDLARNRTCHCLRRLIGVPGGDAVFREDAGDRALSGTPALMTSRFQRRRGRECVVQTIGLADALDEVNAPKFVHYLSLDTEGSELLILQHFDWTRYTIGALTVEHNCKEEHRQGLLELLESHGLRRVKMTSQDDFYLRRSG